MKIRGFLTVGAILAILALPCRADDGTGNMAIGVQLSHRGESGTFGGAIDLTSIKQRTSPEESAFHAQSMGFEIGVMDRKRDDTTYELNPTTMTLSSSTATGQTVQFSNPITLALTLNTSISRHVVIGVVGGFALEFVRKISQDTTTGNLVATGDSLEKEFFGGGNIQFWHGQSIWKIGVDSRRGVSLGYSRRLDL